MIPLTTLLSNYHPQDHQEQLSKNTILTFIKAHPNAFERTLLIGHLTASALLLNTTKTKFLLLHHKKLNKWLQPGGHCDGNTDVLAVAIKETQEESGIDTIEALSPEIFDIDIHTIPHYKEIPEHIHYDIRFLLKTTHTDTVLQNHESNQLQWFSFDEQPPTHEPSLLRMITKARGLI